MFREVVSELVHVVHESGSRSEQARRLHDAFGAIVADGLAAGDVTRRHDAETLTEMILGAYYVLIFNYANLDDFPLVDQAVAVARFLAMRWPQTPLRPMLRSAPPRCAAALRPCPRSSHGSTRRASTIRFRFRTAGLRGVEPRAARGRRAADHYFGHDLVLFRTRSGQSRVLDAFCPTSARISDTGAA